MPRFLVHFVTSKLADFAVAEFKALADMVGGVPGGDVIVNEESVDVEDSPFVLVEMPSVEAVRAVASRAVLVRCVHELWGQGESLEEMVEAVRGQPESVTAPFMAEELSWSIQVSGFGLALTMAEQAEHRNLLSFLPFRGPVNVKRPDTRFDLLEDYGKSDMRDRSGATASLAEGEKPALRRAFFGRVVADGDRKIVNTMTLKKRRYLGPTSMDAEIALVMANLGQARPGAFVFDPFVGTASVLVAAAARGAFCMGTDIDIRVLKGKGGRKIADNFRQYGLPLPEIARVDNSAGQGRTLKEHKPVYHAIITDPPYGVRAGARKSGSRRSVVKSVNAEKRAGHIPQTQPYDAVDVMEDLLEMAARTLVMGGRLVYVLPTTSTYTDAELPVHPCLRVVHNCEQKLTCELARRFIVMKKHAPWDAEAAARGEYAAAAAAAREAAEAAAAGALSGAGGAGGAGDDGPSYADIKARLARAKAERDRADAEAEAAGGYLSKKSKRRWNRRQLAARRAKGAEGAAHGGSDDGAGADAASPVAAATDATAQAPAAASPPPPPNAAGGDAAAP